MDVLFLCLLCF